MGDPFEMEAPVTREGVVGALKLVMVVLAAAILWESAVGVHAEFQARGLTTAPPFTRGAARLLLGVETTAPFPQRISAFLGANHRLVALVAMMAASIALVTRYLGLGRIFDYLYLESEARGRRFYTGFLAGIMLAFGHAGAMYGVVSLCRGERASFVPMALLALLGLNLLWFLKVILSARKVERHALRGIGYLAGTALTAGVALFCATWAIESVPAGDPAIRGSQLVLLSAGVALALCCADGYLQSRIYYTPARARASAQAGE